MRAGLLAVAWFAGACGKPAPAPDAVEGELRGTFTVGAAPARLERCRPGHAVHVFVEVDTSLGTLRFGEGKLYWDGNELTCAKLDRSWGGGIRQDGSTYFRGTLAFRCGKLDGRGTPTGSAAEWRRGSIEGDLRLSCGQVTPAEAAQLDANRAAAIGSAGPR
jgi:hypothetical protein